MAELLKRWAIVGARLSGRYQGRRRQDQCGFRRSLAEGPALRSPGYLVAPRQPWLDGFAIEKGVIRQFVAMPFGDGYTVEEQMTGEAEWGGLQMKRSAPATSGTTASSRIQSSPARTKRVIFTTRS